MKKWVMPVAFIALVAVLAGPALAGGKAKTTSSSSIAIATIDGTTMNATTKSPTPALGDTLTWSTTVGSIAGWEYPMVVLSCYQDVNGDGRVDTNLLGPDVVFTQLAKPDANYTLGGSSSIWTQRGGGDAVCRAELDAYGWKGGMEFVRVLATTGDWNATG